jgi:hypothetical protein
MIDKNHLLFFVFKNKTTLLFHDNRERRNEIKKTKESEKMKSNVRGMYVLVVEFTITLQRIGVTQLW